MCHIRLILTTTVFVAVLAAATPSLAQGQESVVLQQVVSAVASDPLTTEEVRGVLVTRFALLPSEESLLEDHANGRYDNLALIRQAGAQNLASITQQGTDNLSLIIQGGDSNSTSVVQIGVGNIAGIRLDGYGNSLGTEARPGVLQIGDDNVYVLEFGGSYFSIAPTVQEGVGNQVIQTGEITIPFGVEQYGNGQTLIIQHNE